MNNIKQQQDQLRSIGIKFEVGLLELEIKEIEKNFSIQFPHDLKEFLMAGLPVSEGFPNWRTEQPEKIKQWISQPLEGLLFDIEINNVWLKQWGEKPTTIESTKKRIMELYNQAPKLIPIYKHRYIPSVPATDGNPVFSVWQSDIIIYGLDFSHYLSVEFKIDNPTNLPKESRRINFWNDFLQ
ncbi:MAG: hypothetical protein K0S38_245 [Candidatus Paceibacter sp.]|jgi:hypothetical protein|nr:hypothetical protein [Candidatus Paceibacter sp.]